MGQAHCTGEVSEAARILATLVREVAKESLANEQANHPGQDGTETDRDRQVLPARPRLLHIQRLLNPLLAGNLRTLVVADFGKESNDRLGFFHSKAA